MAQFNETGYDTHVLGTVGSIVEGLKIVVYNKYDFSSYGRISLYNLEEFYNNVIKTDYYIELTRVNPKSPYEYLCTNKNLGSGFNIIIYLDNTDNKPIGYTEFSRLQGKERDILIYPEQTSDVTGFNIVLANSLSYLVNHNISANKIYVGNDLKDYTSSLIAKNSIKEGVDSGYTRSLTELLHDSCSKGIYLDTGFIKNNKEAIDYYRFGIGKNIEFSPYGYDFTNFGVSYYGDDIILYVWKDNNYYAISLTKRNKFGNQMVYTKSGVGYFTLPLDSSEYVKNEILYTAGKYIICKSTLSSISNKSVMRIFDIIDKSWVNLKTKNFVIDELDPYNQIIELPDSLYFKDINKYLPDLVNTKYDLSGNMQINIVRKVGHWVLLKRRVKGGNTLYIWSGISNILYLTEDEINTIMVLDDNTLVRYFDDPNNPRYYFYGGFNQTYYTYNARKLQEQIDKTIKSSTEPKVIHVKGKNIETGLWTENNDICNTLLNQYRRGPYPIEFTEIPKIVCTIGGIMFYKNGNYLNYL